ncbi:MAG: hypothetical protein HY302_07260 [Opitutae bacterium]|nr:hypothetical protein [Opitutae bacterium]
MKNLNIQSVRFAFLIALMGIWLPAAQAQSIPSGAQTSGYDVFSTTEVLTNKVWIDGKLIYRKVVPLGNFPNATTKSVPHGIVNATFTSVSGIGWGSNAYGAYSFNLPFVYFSPYEISMQIGGVGGANIEIRTTSNFAITYVGYAILEYTKN